MHLARTGAAVAAWVTLALSLPGCTSSETNASLAALLPPPPPLPSFPEPPAAPESAEPPPPNAVRDEIYRWFSAAGYQDFQIEALAEHARIESGFHPCAAGAGGMRYTFQWGGTRLRHLHEFAGTQGCPKLDAQLAFADHELKNEDRYACFWHATSGPAALAALRRGFGRGSC
ncbi:MAG TPA: hypothetical protein VFA12_13860 [Stellaceae bacterium]|nr:hypothetical protein [Stellaceae bacterium]